MSASAPFVTTERLRTLLQLSPAAIAAAPISLPYELSPVEYAMVQARNVRMALFYPKPADWNPAQGGEFMQFDRLRASFERLLVSYPLLCSRMERRDGDRAPFVAGLDGGVRWVEAEVNLPLSQMPIGTEFKGEAQYPAGVRLLDPFNPLTAFDAPMSLFQLTRFSCGSVSLCLNFNHYIADGEACFNMLRDWTGLYQKSASQDLTAVALDVEPHFDREWLRPASWLPTKEEQEAEAAVQRARPVQANWITLPVPLDLTKLPPPPPVAVRVIRFPAAELAALKAATDGALKQEIAKGGPGSENLAPWVSTVECVVTHMLRCMHQARAPAGSEAAANPAPLRLSVTANIRDRLSAAPKGKFFGNAFLHAVSDIDVALMAREASAEGELKQLALTTSDVHKGLRGMTSESLKQSLAWLEYHPQKEQVLVMLRVERGLLIPSWHKFGPHTVEFEGGCKPCQVAPLPAFAGLGFIVDTPEMDGTLDVHIGLEPEAMERLIGAEGQLHKFATA